MHPYTVQGGTAKSRSCLPRQYSHRQQSPPPSHRLISSPHSRRILMHRGLLKPIQKMYTYIFISNNNDLLMTCKVTTLQSAFEFRLQL